MSVLPHDLCTAIGGLDVSEARVAAYERSWIHRALGLQRQLDDAVPFLRELVPHTHNSFNSSAYPATLTQLDPNQLYSMRDQLRMDMRGIEMDVHPWSGSGGAVPRQRQGPMALKVHLGCSVDRPFTDGLAELSGWLAEPANPDEVVILYLENTLDGNRATHSMRRRRHRHHPGRLVYRPAAAPGPCAADADDAESRRRSAPAVSAS